jgi:hypothetical protein
VKKCTSGDDQLRYQHPRLCHCLGARRRARDLFVRAPRAEWTILLFQAEFANVATREAGIPIEDIRRRSMLGVAHSQYRRATRTDLAAALEAVRGHRVPFWGAMLWFRRNVCLLTEDLQDGFVLTIAVSSSIEALSQGNPHGERETISKIEYRSSIRQPLNWLLWRRTLKGASKSA